MAMWTAVKHAHPFLGSASSPAIHGDVDRPCGTAIIVAPDVARLLPAPAGDPAASPVFVLRDSEDAEGAVARVVRDGSFQAALLDGCTRGEELSQVCGGVEAAQAWLRALSFPCPSIAMH
eukprot:362078-Chlamydomonas_euryale.AAC.8